MPSKGASKKTAKGFAEILNAARAAGLTDPDTANARNGALYYLALNDPIMSAAMQSVRESGADHGAVRGQDRAARRWRAGILLDLSVCVRRGPVRRQIGNTPLTFAGLKKGDTIAFGKRDIVDWMYMDAGTMKGNYSARAILKAALPRDRAAFKRRFGLEFDF